ncbi:MAG TPA: alanine racemase [Bacteroidia bacterium]|nr:alanine racemase [Bacteroidia bacterium]
MFHTSVIEISRSALEHNIAFINNMLGPQTKFSSVVKGNAYGHGIEEFASIANENSINHFSVFSADEALRVKKVAPNATVMIMGMIDDNELEWAIENQIQFYIFDPERADAAIAIAKKIKQAARIHLEVETGMNRTGCSKEELIYILKKIEQNPNDIIIEGLCTHYAGAENIANYLRIKEQIRKFNHLSKWLANQGISPKIKHTSCSASSIAYPQTKMDMARIGILQYGFWPSRETFIHYLNHQPEKQDPLKRVIRWKSKVMSTKFIKIGEFVSYGTTYLAQKDMKIANVPVGYAQGYSRSLSNQGRVLVNGTIVNVISIVSMNMITIDITDVPQTKKGDEVVLIGDQGNLSISVSSFSELSSQLNYELLTRLPGNIPRIIVD